MTFPNVAPRVKHLPLTCRFMQVVLVGERPLLRHQLQNIHDMYFFPSVSVNETFALTSSSRRGHRSPLCGETFSY